MKQFNLIILFFALFVLACSYNSIKTEDNSPQNSEVSSRSSEGNLIELEVDSNEYISKFHQLFGTDFKIERMYEYSDDIEMKYIYAEGYNSSDKSLTSRYSRAKGGGETCTSVDCEECRFLAQGGCFCHRDAHGERGSCNHTITKE